jgi:23S rRNA (uracil1939-C5)-methyltransferase
VSADVQDLTVSKLVAGGDGLGFIDGKAVFVPGVLPGERVRVRLLGHRRDFDRAALVEVLEPSRHRVHPPCRLAGICGGCDWLHIAYDRQLALKVEIVRESLRRTGGIECAALDIEPSPPLASRNRAQIHRSAAGALGYMGAGSTTVVPVQTCPIVVRPIDALFDGSAAAPASLDRFTVWSDGGSVAVEGLDDDRDLAVRVCGRPFAFSVGCFFQSNLAVLEKLVPWALDGLAGEVAADLYCGVGVFAAFLAERFLRVVCVESSALGLSHARRNVGGQGSEFNPMSVEQWISTGAASGARAFGQVPGAFDCVVVDPPRPGLSPEMRAWLRPATARTLIYVSCNPVTLARDLGQLVLSGFLLEDLRLFDFYPQTSHVEAVAKLRAKK